MRIVVTGSECTGKTTLACALAGALGTTWVPEYSRAYARQAGRPLQAADVEPIARGQLAAEDAAEAAARGPLVLDTDLVSTVVYARHYYGACPRWIEDAAVLRRGALYLLCAPDLPWSADGVRDRGDRREEVDALFRTELARLGAAVFDVTGLGDSRTVRALDAVRGILP